MPVFKSVKKLPKHLEDKILSLSDKANRLEELYAAITEGLLDDGIFDNDFKGGVFH
jgi:hypothetical protein